MVRKNVPRTMKETLSATNMRSLDCNDSWFSGVCDSKNEATRAPINENENHGKIGVVPKSINT
jgi:hypothetical protein